MGDGLKVFLGAVIGALVTLLLVGGLFGGMGYGMMGRSMMGGGPLGVLFALTFWFLLLALLVAVVAWFLGWTQRR